MASPLKIKAVKVPHIPQWYGLPFVMFAVEIRLVPGQMVMRTRYRVLMPCRWMMSRPTPN